MEAVCSSETFVSSYQTTRCHNPEEHNTQLYLREDLRSHTRGYIPYIVMHVSATNVVFYSTQQNIPNGTRMHVTTTTKSRLWVSLAADLLHKLGLQLFHNVVAHCWKLLFCALSIARPTERQKEDSVCVIPRAVRQKNMSWVPRDPEPRMAVLLRPNNLPKPYQEWLCYWSPTTYPNRTKNDCAGEAQQQITIPDKTKHGSSVITVQQIWRLLRNTNPSSRRRGGPISKCSQTLIHELSSFLKVVRKPKLFSP
jgi:hypothetical protein